MMGKQRLRILCCINRDLQSNVALNLLLPALSPHEVRVCLTEGVGRTAAPSIEALERRELRTAEQSLPIEFMFPLIDKAELPDRGRRYLTLDEIARHRRLRVELLTDPNCLGGLEFISAFAPDLIVTIRYGAILKPPVIAIPKLGVLNFHSGVLPDYRGVLATFRALMAGVPEVGCTLHYISDDTIDTGAIVGVSRMPVSRERSLLWHTLALYPLGIPMLVAALAELGDERSLSSTPQPVDAGTYYSYPTATEWAEFTRRGWVVAQPSDIHDVFRRYVAE
jgi:methionyl-tRNA formyltransferase